jgi:hypothetical protein
VSASAEAFPSRDPRVREPSPRIGAASVTFRLHGVVNGHAVRAFLGGGRIAVDEELRDQAAVLVAMGEVIQCDDVPLSVTATLDGSPIAILLTLIRACDRVLKAEVTLPTVT